MKIQSLSIVVPAGCLNNCAFCVSKLHEKDNETYKNQIERNRQFKDLYEKDFLDALAFSRDNGCNTMMLTGDGEPILNKDFLEMVAKLNSMIDHPFRRVELQTSGVLLIKK
jgi:molybdenum cofactor biosynthesis enzyme MoaA